MVLKRRTIIIKLTLGEIKKQLEQDKMLESWYYFVSSEEVKKIRKKDKKV